MTSRAEPSFVWLALGDRDVASSRVRAYEMSDALEARGHRSLAVQASGARGRFRALRALVGEQPTVVVVQKVFFGRVMLWLLAKRSKHLVLDCDDAVHLGYPSASRRQANRTTGRLRAALQAVDLLTTSNPVLAHELRPQTGRSIWFAGPAPPKTAGIEPRERVVLWLGSPSTTKHLLALGPVAKHLAANGWRCVAVGATDDVRALGWTVEQWTEARASYWLKRASVGLMPQGSSPWDDRKAAYKVLQYAAAAVVPVASDVPPARVLLGFPPFQDLLVKNGDWAETVVNAAARRDVWTVRMDAVVRPWSVDVCIDALLEALGGQPDSDDTF